MSTLSPVVPQAQFAVGIDIGSAVCGFTVLRADRSSLLKAQEFEHSAAGFAALQTKLEQLGLAKEQLVIGMEATSCYWENLYQALSAACYQVYLLHPAQTAAFARQRGLRAKTDRLDAATIARVLLSGEARPAYVADADITAYRELVRLQQKLTDEAASYKLQLQSLLEVVFPEFRQMFADPTRETALSILIAFPGAQQIVDAGLEAVASKLIEVGGKRYGRAGARELLALASGSVARGVASSARATALRILCDQLAHTKSNIVLVEREIAALVRDDKVAASLSSVPEFGAKTVAVLRSEVGDVARFARGDQLVAYAGLDVRVRESGKLKGQRKVSKRGSGVLRRALYMAAMQSLRMKQSAFGDYYRHLVGHGLSKMSALMAVMRKMLLVMYGLLKNGGVYDPSKVWHNPARQTVTTGEEALAAA